MLKIRTHMSFDLVIQARLRWIAVVVYWMIRQTRYNLIRSFRAAE